MYVKIISSLHLLKLQGRAGMSGSSMLSAIMAGSLRQLGKSFFVTNSKAMQTWSNTVKTRNEPHKTSHNYL